MDKTFKEHCPPHTTMMSEKPSNHILAWMSPRIKRSVQTNIQMPHNRPDIILIAHQEKTGFIKDIAIPRDENIKDKEMENIDKYQPLKIGLERLWEVKRTVIPVVIGLLGAMLDKLTSWLAQIPGHGLPARVCS